MKMDLALNNLQRLICHKTQQTKPNQTINFFLKYFCYFIFNILTQRNEGIKSILFWIRKHSVQLKELISSGHFILHKISRFYGGVRGIAVNIVWTRHGDLCSNSGRPCLHFTYCLYPGKRSASKYSRSSNE